MPEPKSKPAAKKPAVKKKAPRVKKSAATDRDAALGVVRTDKEQETKAARRKADIAKREEQVKEFSINAARMLADDKCRDVLVLDLRGHSHVTDFTVIATGTSDRQMRSAGEHVDKLGEAAGVKLYRHNLREQGAKWVLLDFIDVVVHLFEPESRLFYDIEMLWGDAERIDWERPAERKAREKREAAEKPETRNRAGLRADDVIR